MYKLEVRRGKEAHWYVFTQGSLEDCMEDFFYYKNQSADFIALRLVWEHPEGL